MSGDYAGLRAHRAVADRARQERHGEVPGCEWMLMCEEPAAGVVAHPILGDVPTCQRCADRHGLTFEGDV